MSESVSQPVVTQTLKAEWITPEAFRPYGQVIVASPDGKSYDQDDAQLRLEQGIPRFYIMRLEYKEPLVSRITRHLKCTQCLGSLEGKEWLLAVAPPTSTPYPDLDAITAFRIPGNCFIKLHVGTWHAGPYFTSAWVDFYNLELHDTNVTDQDTWDLSLHHGIAFNWSLD